MGRCRCCFPLRRWQDRCNGSQHLIPQTGPPSTPAKPSEVMPMPPPPPFTGAPTPGTVLARRGAFSIRRRAVTAVAVLVPVAAAAWGTLNCWWSNRCRCQLHRRRRPGAGGASGGGAADVRLPGCHCCPGRFSPACALHGRCQVRRPSRSGLARIMKRPRVHPA